MDKYGDHFFAMKDPGKMGAGGFKRPGDDSIRTRS